MRLAGLIALVALCACGGALVQSEMAAYGGDQLECVNVAQSRDAGLACIDAVRTYWCAPPGGPLYEAGACVYTGSADGGTHP